MNELKFLSSACFGNKLYKAYTCSIDFPIDYFQRKPAPIKSYNDFEHEYWNYFYQDIKSNFYKKPDLSANVFEEMYPGSDKSSIMGENIQGLKESVEETKDMIVILDAKNMFVGKINYFIKESRVNFMFIYSNGHRRDMMFKAGIKNYLSNVYIIWYFAAVFTNKLMGDWGNFLITQPRSNIFRYFKPIKHRFVKIISEDLYIQSDIMDQGKDFRNEINIDTTEPFGVLINSREAINTIMAMNESIYSQIGPNHPEFVHNM